MEPPMCHKTPMTPFEERVYRSVHYRCETCGRRRRITELPRFPVALLLVMAALAGYCFALVTTRSFYEVGALWVPVVGLTAMFIWFIGVKGRIE